MQLSREIFRAYDIRGVYPSDLNEENIEVLGKAVGTLLLGKKLKNVVVGRDNRPSSSTLANCFIAGLISTGCNVTFTGITVEPAIHYFTFLDLVDAAVNITASHNPKDYTGIKIDYKNAVPCFGDDLQLLYKKADEGTFVKGEGTYKEENLNPRYIDFITSKFKLTKRIRVVIYCGNGATSEIYPEILQKIGADVVPLRCYLDSDFPKGVPDPETGTFYSELSSQVLESHANVGVGFDGDGDRVGDVDEKGRAYKVDQLVLLFIKDLLAKNKSAKIIYDVKCSQLVNEYITLHNGVPKMMRTGRSYILDEMYNGNALLGVELSGHVFFKDDYLGYDDGIYATCRLLKIMDESGEKLSKLMSEFPTRISTPEIKVDCADEKKFKVVEKVVALVKADKKYLNVDTTDGARVKVTSTAWFLIRASNTSPYLSIRAEGKDQKEVDRVLQEIARLLSNFKDVILKI
jgi:phosphomannomutase / phosphoglucomutase